MIVFNAVVLITVNLKTFMRRYKLWRLKKKQAQAIKELNLAAAARFLQNAKTEKLGLPPKLEAKKKLALKRTRYDILKA